jgi:hypothetical protein
MSSTSVRGARLRSALVDRALQLALTCIAGGCGVVERSGDTPIDASPDAAAGDAAVDSGLGCGNGSFNDCKQGEWCWGPSTCGSVWQCTSAAPPCLDTPGNLVCGCNGIVRRDCYSDRWAHSLDAQFRSTDIVGQRCNPEDILPYTMTYRVHANGFEAYEGLSIYWLSYPSLREAGLRGNAIRGGAFQDTAGPIVGGELDTLVFFLDVDGDGACDTSEPSGFGTLLSIDLLTKRFDYEIVPPTESRSRCDYIAGGQQ